MATKKELFVVTATEFSYNDETYNVEGDGGQPLSAFFDKKEAEAFITKATAKWVKEMGADNIASHGYGIDDIFHKAPSFLSKEEQEAFVDRDGDTLELIESLKIDERSDEELAMIGDALSFSPFTIHKVTVE